MRDSICVVEVGTHPGPYWRDAVTGIIVCDRHRQQYNEREDLEPFEWEPAPLPEDTRSTTERPSAERLAELAKRPRRSPHVLPPKGGAIPIAPLPEDTT